MSRFARILALLLVAAAIVLAVLAFTLGRHKADAEPDHVAATPVAPVANPPATIATATSTAQSVPLGIAMQLLPGERALAIPIDEVAGVGNRIAPGDYVDVFFDLKKAQDKDGPTQARLLLSRTHVLAYGNRVLGAKPVAAGEKEEAQRTEATSPRTAVLAVPVDAVDGLLLATREGKLSLALRHPEDHGAPDTALFAPPPPVLSTRRSLTADQQVSAGKPENKAFAGIDAEGLEGRGATAPAHPARPQPVNRGATAEGGVEIIRGAQRGRLFATPSCASGTECTP